MYQFNIKCILVAKSDRLNDNYKLRDDELFSYLCEHLKITDFHSDPEKK